MDVIEKVRDLMQHWNRFGKPETMKFRTSYCTTKPSFSDASSALFSHVLYTRLNMPCLILRFSSAEPFRADDTPVGNMERCCLLIYSILLVHKDLQLSSPADQQASKSDNML